MRTSGRGVPSGAIARWPVKMMRPWPGVVTCSESTGVTVSRTLMELVAVAGWVSAPVTIVSGREWPRGAASVQAPVAVGRGLRELDEVSAGRGLGPERDGNVGRGDTGCVVERPGELQGRMRVAAVDAVRQPAGCGVERERVDRRGRDRGGRGGGGLGVGWLSVVIVWSSTVEVFWAASVTVTLRSCWPSVSAVVSTGMSTVSVCGQGCWLSNISAPVGRGRWRRGAQSPWLVFGVAS